MLTQGWERRPADSLQVLAATNATATGAVVATAPSPGTTPVGDASGLPEAALRGPVITFPRGQLGIPHVRQQQQPTVCRAPERLARLIDGIEWDDQRKLGRPRPWHRRCAARVVAWRSMAQPILTTSVIRVSPFSSPCFPGCNGMIVAGALGFCGNAFAYYEGSNIGNFGPGITVVNLTSLAAVRTVPVARGVGVNNGAYDAVSNQARAAAGRDCYARVCEVVDTPHSGRACMEITPSCGPWRKYSRSVDCGTHNAQIRNRC